MLKAKVQINHNFITLILARNTDRRLINYLYSLGALELSIVGSYLNITKTCPCDVYRPLTPLLYSKTGVCRGIPIFLIFAPKHRL